MKLLRLYNLTPNISKTLISIMFMLIIRDLNNALLLSVYFGIFILGVKIAPYQNQFLIITLPFILLTEGFSLFMPIGLILVISRLLLDPTCSIVLQLHNGSIKVIALISLIISAILVYYLIPIGVLEGFQESVFQMIKGCANTVRSAINNYFRLHKIAGSHLPDDDQFGSLMNHKTSTIRRDIEATRISLRGERVIHTYNARAQL